MTDTIRHYINGEFVASSRTEPDPNPSDSAEVIAECSIGGAADIDVAVRAAAAAGPAWRATVSLERARILDAIGTRIMERKAELGSLLAREEGKLLADAIAEAAKAGWVFKFYAGLALQLHGASGSRLSTEGETLISREPVGVIGLIVPFNAPLIITAWKAAPALACGNTVVIKPSELAPAAVDAMTRIIAAVGLPPGVFNVVYGHGAEVGQALVSHPEVAGVSFTGSEATGARVAIAAIPRLAKIQLELGGKNAFVIADDADPVKAAKLAVAGAFHGAGQRCTATSRIIILDAGYDAVVAALIAATKALRVGAALDPGATLGPLTTRSQLERCAEVIARATADGGRVIATGTVAADSKRGHYQTPILIDNTAADTSINQHEIFGPVATIIRVRDLDEAISVANATRFGLSAGIATGSLNRARLFRQRVRAGLIAVNQTTSGVDLNAPFSAMRASGYGGAEQGVEALHFYSVTKTAYIADA